MSHPTPIVFVVDDDASVRRSLEALIRREGWRSETFASAAAFLTRPPVPAPSCLVVEAALPDLDGLELQRRLAAERSDLPVIFVARDADVSMVVRAVKAGAIEFFAKPFRDDALFAALRHAIEGSRAALEREAELRALLDAYGSLSRRERQVMGLVASGLLNKQIGGELGISVITVKAHRGRMMRKMGAESVAELVNMTARLPLAPADRELHHRDGGREPAGRTRTEATRGRRRAAAAAAAGAPTPTATPSAGPRAPLHRPRPRFSRPRARHARPSTAALARLRPIALRACTDAVLDGGQATARSTARSAARARRAIHPAVA